MPNELITTDPIVAQNFFLEIDGDVVTILSGVSGLDVEVDVVTMQQAGTDGKVQVVKTRGNDNKAPDLSLTRMAPSDATARTSSGAGSSTSATRASRSDRANNRKNGSIVLYDTSNVEIGRFNFINGWPSKIATDAVSTESNDPVKETITLVSSASTGSSEPGLRTSYDFTLPRGYVDGQGRRAPDRHGCGSRRPATSSSRCATRSSQGPDDPRLTILVLTRVVESAGQPGAGDLARHRGPVRRRPGVPAGLLRRDQLRQPGGVRRAGQRPGGDLAGRRLGRSARPRNRRTGGGAEVDQARASRVRIRDRPCAERSRRSPRKVPRAEVIADDALPHRSHSGRRSSFLAYHLHWRLDDLLDLEHMDRVRMVRAVVSLNDRAWEAVREYGQQ